MTKQFKIVVERHPDGYVAYPLGVKGVVVGQGDTYGETLDDVTSAIRFHIETFGEEALEIDPPGAGGIPGRSRRGVLSGQVPRRRA